MQSMAVMALRSQLRAEEEARPRDERESAAALVESEVRDDDLSEEENLRRLEAELRAYLSRLEAGAEWLAFLRRLEAEAEQVSGSSLWATLDGLCCGGMLLAAAYGYLFLCIMKSY
ncbi:hypothetical protein PR202_gb27721 [Eleusine coracana subsp. coracana]|uniref:Uncharacterized protein n=1 Tax=Eleusine coracana subsp. coracana TaxID=191504 RepID=A0AAV5FUI6_ELECO|nr:hypothetical protein PR202_gb27721 [Eleusine coracana subsp. coracana]